MSDMNSKGLLRLSHYRSSKVSMSKYEPIYQNLWTVQITPPTGLVSYTDGSDEVNVILEGVRSVGGLATSKNSGSVLSQKYKFAERSFAGANPNTSISPTIKWALNLQYVNGQPSNYVWNFLRAWNDLIYDPLTGKMGLKKDYTAPSMTITIHDRAGTPFHQWILYDIFPTSEIPAPDLNYDSDSLWELSMTYQCNLWDEVSL